MEKTGLYLGKSLPEEFLIARLLEALKEYTENKTNETRSKFKSALMLVAINMADATLDDLLKDADHFEAASKILNFDKQ